MINAMEVIVQYFKTAGIPANGQVAVKHRYPDPWPIKSPGIALLPDGGEQENYLPVHRQRVEVRCYGEDAYTALTLLDSVINLALGTCRETVETTAGTGILYSFTQESGPSLLFDDDLQMDFALAFFEAKVSHQSV